MCKRVLAVVILLVLHIHLAVIHIQVAVIHLHGVVIHPAIHQARHLRGILV